MLYLEIKYNKNLIMFMMGINFESRRTVLEHSKQNKAIEMGLFFFSELQFRHGKIANKLHLRVKLQRFL